MARTRRLIWQHRTPTVAAALAALCVSILIFFTLLDAMRRAPARGAGLLRVLLLNGVTPTPEIASSIGSARRKVSKESRERNMHDADTFSDSENLAPAEPVRTVPIEIEPTERIAFTTAVDSVAPGYLPAKLLSVRPVVMRDIASDLPAGVDASDQSVLFLQLLINEYGDIDRVIVDDGTLPASAVADLVQRFLHMRFFPGRLDGRVVPAAMRIAVTLQADR